MSSSDTSTVTQRETPRIPAGPDADREPALDSGAFLDLVGDEYARSILNALGEDARSAPELIEELDASHPTIYRRLNRLEDAGVVTTSLCLRPDGHHRTEYRLALDDVVVSLADGLDVDTAQ